MSTIVDKKPKKFKKFHIERFDSAMEMAQTCKTRPITDSRFDDKSKGTFGSFEGVSTYQEALDLLNGGYQPTVDAMRGVFKAGIQGNGSRFAFQNSVVGFAPVVPLALKNVPNSMIGMTMKPIKCKVVDVYYDMTCSCGTDSKDIIEAGRKLLSAVIELERQGYRFNLYAVQGYNDNAGCDMAVVKVKSATQPLDLKRISFPLTHTAFFRVIGFDWYSYAGFHNIAAASRGAGVLFSGKAVTSGNVDIREAWIEIKDKRGKLTGVPIEWKYKYQGRIENRICTGNPVELKKVTLSDGEQGFYGEAPDVRFLEYDAGLIVVGVPPVPAVSAV